MTAVIALDEVSKHFRVPLDRSTTLKYRVTHWRSASRYRTFMALRNVTFEVGEGEFLGITGANGSGKSTLLKILSRIYTADSGRVTVSGRVSPFLELGVGFNPELTARENVYLNGAVIGLTRVELSRRLDSIIGFAELEDFADQKLKNFSSGMQVRLAFSVAIQADAGILLMDEVLAVGDARFQEKCFDVFARYKREGRTVVLVTHDLSAIENHCDRALLINHGAIVADGPPARVTAQYRRMVGERSDNDAVPQNDQVQRWGDQTVAEIKGVRLLDGAEQAHTTFAVRQPMVLEVTYVTHRAVEDLVCGIGIRRNDGLVVAGTSTGIDAVTIPPPTTGEPAVIRYEIDTLPLAGGSYYVAVSLVDRPTNHTYDHLEGLSPFRVVDERGLHGVVELGGHWALG